LNPNAWLFRDEYSSSLQAFVCTKCGYTALFAEDPAILAAAYRSIASPEPPEG
jgi:hypothetical protein